MDELFNKIEEYGETISLDEFSSVLIKTGLSLLAALFPLKGPGG